MEMLNLKQEQKNKVIDEFLNSIKNWEDCLALTTFVLMKLSQEAISMNAGELALSQSLSHNGEIYMTRMSIQYSKQDEKSLENRSLDLAEKIAKQYPNESELSLLQKAVISGYNLHLDDYDDDDE